VDFLHVLHEGESGTVADNDIIKIAADETALEIVLVETSKGRSDLRSQVLRPLFLHFFGSVLVDFSIEYLDISSSVKIFDHSSEFEV
jgi:hypothetical protein